MAIAFTLSPAVWAATIVAKLKTNNSEIKGKAEADLIKHWTLICEAHQTHIMASLEVTTITSTPGAMVGPTVLPGTGTSAP